MKKFVLFSLLSAFCLSIASCAMINKKEEGKKEEGKKKPSESASGHRRYNSQS